MKAWNCPTCGGLVRREVHPDGLIMARACAKAGYCAFCEEPLPARKRKRRLICGSPECTLAYSQAYKRDWRFARRARV